MIAITAEFIPLLTYRINTNTEALCSNSTWPSCSITSEYSGYGGYLNNTGVQYFNVKEMFDDIKLAQPGELVPNVASVSSLPAYFGETELGYLYLPFVNLTCLNYDRGFNNLTYENFTREFFQTRTDVAMAVANCTRDDIFCG